MMLLGQFVYHRMLFDRMLLGQLTINPVCSLSNHFDGSGLFGCLLGRVCLVCAVAWKKMKEVILRVSPIIWDCVWKDLL